MGLVNVAIEAELAAGGQVCDGLLGDYGPFAQAEVVDWLRHRGAYAEGAQHAGEGAPAGVVGPWVSRKGARRSRFYSHPSSAEAPEREASFNAVFGTGFRSWRLAYGDPELWPAPISDSRAPLIPEAGAGACPGGFDAPRLRRPDDAFWRAWTYDICDHGGQPPPGAGAQAAFGFRQAMVRHYVGDLLGAVVAAGVDPRRVFAHQIRGKRVQWHGCAAARRRCGRG